MILPRTLIAAVAAAALAFAGGAAAQAYPGKQVNVAVSFPPGGDTDALARLFSEATHWWIFCGNER